LCGADLAGGKCCALVRDGGVIRPATPSLDGWRLLTACTPEHLIDLTHRHRDLVNARQQG
jgi:hypothetical protein